MFEFFGNVFYHCLSVLANSGISEFLVLREVTRKVGLILFLSQNFNK